MLLVLIVSAFTLCAASPFHKYPFVFLLDVGNEELGKANTEQIKVSVPGGVIALKFPATGDGDVIGHVRVTGIDFGTDLKANIVEGGPGYRYVVLVLMGAPGMQYDTVITIQTLDEDIKQDNSEIINDNSYKVREDDSNDSAEDLKEESEQNSVYREKMSADIVKTNSNTFRYTQNGNIDENNQKDASDDSSFDNKINYNREDGIDSTKADDIRQLSSDTYSYVHNENSDVEGSQDLNSERQNDDVINYKIQDAIDDESNDDEESNVEDEIGKINAHLISNSDMTYNSVMPLTMLAGYGKYDAFKPQFYGNVHMVYPQEVLQDRGYMESVKNDDNSVQFDGEKDSNNNIDDYDSSLES